MPTIEDLERLKVDPENPADLRALRERWIQENQAPIEKILFICRILGKDTLFRGREWSILNVEAENIQFRLLEDAAYHKAGTVNDWLFTRILIVTVGKTTLEPLGMRENKVCWMNLSDHDHFDPDHPFRKSENVFIPGAWMICLDWLGRNALKLKQEHEKEMAEFEAKQLREQLLIGKVV